jgi:hypothetical protein
MEYSCPKTAVYAHGLGKNKLNRKKDDLGEKWFTMEKLTSTIDISGFVEVCITKEK